MNIFDPHFSIQQHGDAVFLGFSGVLNWWVRESYASCVHTSKREKGACGNEGKKTVKMTSQGCCEDEVS